MGKCWSPPQECNDSSTNVYARSSCGPQYSINPSSLPVITRLTSRRREYPIEKIKDRLERKIAAPLGALPEWECMPLDEKIPAVPAPEGTMKFTRGELGRPIKVKKAPFTLRDPYNREHSAAYDPLHDRHAARFFDQPVTRQLLMQQKLIDDEGRVLCSLKEFNRYRHYLHTVYSESFHEYIQEQDLQDKKDLETQKELSSLDLKRERTRRALLAEERRKAAAERRRAAWEDLAIRMEAKQNREKIVLQCQMENRIRNQVIKALMSRQNHAEHQQKYQALRAQKGWNNERGVVYLARKEVAVQKRAEDDKESKSDMHKYYIAEWLLTKWKDQERRVDREEQVREGIEYFLEDKSMERRRRLELYRRKMREITQKKKDEAARKAELVRKYFYYWLERIREIRAERALHSDSLHLSCWDTRTVLKNMVSQLRVETNRGEKKFVFLINLALMTAHQAAESGKQEEKPKVEMFKVEANPDEELEQVARQIEKEVEKEQAMNPDEILQSLQPNKAKAAQTVSPRATRVSVEVPRAKKSSRYVTKKVGIYGRKRPSLTNQNVQRKKTTSRTNVGGGNRGRAPAASPSALSNRNPLMEKYK